MINRGKCLTWLLLFSTGASSQIPQPEQESTNGVNLVESVVNLAPPIIVAKLLDSSRSERRFAFKALGYDLDESDVRVPPPLQFHNVNLDEDEDQEAVLAFRQMGVSTALVFDRRGDSWWKVGTFTNGFRNQGGWDTFFQLRSIVDSGRYDLVVRISGGGTDFVETEYMIYRLRRGHLISVLGVIEEARYRVVGGRSSQAQYERAVISFITREDSDPDLIVIDFFQMPLAQLPAFSLERLVSRRAPDTCVVYVWNERVFGFSEDPKLVSRFCAASTRSRRAPK